MVLKNSMPYTVVLAGNLLLSLKQDGDTKIGDIGMTKVPGLATWR